MIKLERPRRDSRMVLDISPCTGSLVPFTISTCITRRQFVFKEDSFVVCSTKMRTYFSPLPQAIYKWCISTQYFRLQNFLPHPVVTCHKICTIVSNRMTFLCKKKIVSFLQSQRCCCVYIKVVEMSHISEYSLLSGDIKSYDPSFRLIWPLQEDTCMHPHTPRTHNP